MKKPIEEGTWSYEMVVGLVYFISTVRDSIKNIMSQADETIKPRLQNF